LTVTQKSFFDNKYRHLSNNAVFLNNRASVALTIDYRRIAAMFKRVVRNNTVVADLGCGDQPQAFIFTPEGNADVTGLDFSPYGLDVASRRAAAIGYPGAFTPVVGNALHTAFDSATFDAAVHSMTLEHISETEQAIAEAARILKSGGRFFVFTVNRKHILRGLFERIFSSHYEDMCHSKEGSFTMEQIHAWFNRHGLEVEESFYAFSFESAVWDYYLLPRLMKFTGNRFFRRIIMAVRTVIARLAIIDFMMKKTGNSSCLVLVGRKR
jgi:ubiquinone/menaquinone biosynthesis C-methylase UbiE